MLVLTFGVAFSPYQSHLEAHGCSNPRRSSGHFIAVDSKNKSVLFCPLRRNGFIWLEKCFFLTLEKYRWRLPLSGCYAKEIWLIRKHSDTLHARSNTYTLPWGPYCFSFWYTRSFVFCLWGTFSKWLLKGCVGLRVQITPNYWTQNQWKDNTGE